MKPASDFSNKFLNQSFDQTKAAVFTREEVDVLLQHDYISEINAELLRELCYEVERDPNKDFYVPRITHCTRDQVEYSRKQVMGLKAIANRILQQQNHGG